MRRRRSIICFISALMLLSLISVVIHITGPMILRSIIDRRMVLLKGSKSLASWMSQDEAHASFSVYLFNITNPREMVTGERARLHQVGPFVFDLKVDKQIINVTDDHITYFITESFSLNRDKTYCSLDLLIYTANLSLLTAVNDKNNWFGEGFIGDTCDSSALMSKTVRQMLLEKHDQRHGIPGGLMLPRSQLDLISSSLDDDSFGIKITRGPFIISTGSKDLNQIGSMKHLCDSESNVESTDGSLFHPYVKRSTLLSVVPRDICSPAPLKYQGSSSDNGLTTYRDDFYHTRGSKDCICIEPNCNRNRCPVSGLVNVTNTKIFKDFLLSRPHFFEASSDLIRVTGLEPKLENHATYFNVEPFSGIVLESAARIQFNVLLLNNPYVKPLRQLTNAVIPVFWQEEIHSRHFDGWMHQATVDRILLVFGIFSIVCAWLAFTLSVFLFGKHSHWIL